MLFMFNKCGLNKSQLKHKVEKLKESQGKITMQDSVLISVITPCFNSEKTIAQTMESMLLQTYNNYEYIVIDGGSTDNTVNILEAYKPKFNRQMKYYSEKDNGIYDAMNKGIKMATGEIVGILNSDDYYESDCLEIVRNSYDSNARYQILYGAIRIVNPQGEELEVCINNHRNLKNKMVYHPSAFVTNTVYKELFMYDTQYRYASDYDFMLKASHCEKIEFKPIYKILSNFRTGGASSLNKAIMESGKVSYKHHLISKSQYSRILIKGIIKELFKTINNN